MNTNSGVNVMDHVDNVNSEIVVLPAKELTIEISTFANKYTSAATSLSLDCEGFLKILTDRDIRKLKDGKMFAPATFNGKRSNNDFIVASGICLDFDHGQPDIEHVLSLFPGTLAAYYSTHSHCWRNTEKNQDGMKIPADTTYTPENPRFRLVIPLSRQVDVTDHALLVSGIKSIIPCNLFECLDSTCFERSRSHYLPSCLPGHEIHAFSGIQEGSLLDVDHYISLVCDEQPTTKHIYAEPASKKPLVPMSVAPQRQYTYKYTEPNSGEVINLSAWASRNSTVDIIGAVYLKYRRGDIRNGKQHIQCPFEAEHTDQSSDLATFIANASPPQHDAWDIHCCHSHCAGRDRLDFLSVMLEEKWISADLLQIGTPAEVTMKRPPKIYFPVNEVLAASDWSSLVPDERRIALDLMAIAWASDDGTIADDNWQIARRLGLPENIWLGYRETLVRAGWLIVSDGQLTNAIVHREFKKAQSAYMAVIIKASNGGKSTQIKARKNKTQHDDHCFKHPLQAPA